METGVPETKPPAPGLSSEKREDIWALLIALLVLVISLIAPEGLYDFFKKTLFPF
ncbi:MAG: hypothetical protein ABIF77_03040 [bacterium]